MMNNIHKSASVGPLRTCVIVVAVGAAFLAHAVSAQQAAEEKKDAAKAHVARPRAMHKEYADEGQRVFAENCSRCHTSPDGFSQRISGTVVRHMRVRASLSREDEKALMRFFNP